MNEIKRFVGTFQVRDLDGRPKLYRRGDVVDYKGEQYVAVRNTKSYTPLHQESRSGWRKISSSNTMNFTNSDSEPETPNEGDHWFNSSSGKLFIYIKDKDTEQWIEL
tara:strand:- start:83 stop:403 length:321 start_codon:yes stop_codon:yes gene_type:complete